ncbi:hypothetical protein SAMN04487957_1161, partial [Halomonas shengliensis]
MTIATVTAITGQAWARDADGNLRELSIGDTLQEGEVLVTADGASVELDFGDNLDPTVIQGGQEVAMTPDLGGEEAVAEEEATALDEDLEALLTAIDEGEGDLLAELDPTAAGAGPGGGAEGGHSFVMLARIAEPLSPLSYEFGMGALDSGEFPEDEFIAQAEEEVVEEPVMGLVSFELLGMEGAVNLGGSSIVEDENFLIVATVDTPPTGTPLEITLSNGQQITIAVGEITGQVAFESREDDFFIQGDETIGLSVADTSGGGYDELTIGDVPSLTVVDDNDTTTVTLDDVTVNEAQQLVYTASVDNAPQGAFSVTLNNGVVINFADGALTGSSEPQPAQGEDVYLDADSFPISIASTSGGNYEALDTTDTATVTITDTTDTTTVTLDDVTVNEAQQLV